MHRSSLFILGSLFVLAVAAENVLPRSAPTVLAGGSDIEYGSIPNLKWQATGYLAAGCSPPVPSISNCYSLGLSSNPSIELDPGFPTSPRQRIEFLTAGASDGSSYKFTWKYRLSPSSGTSSHFFHIMQLFSRGINGPVVTLDAVKGKIAIVDYARGCSGANICPSIPLSTFNSRTTLHTMLVKFGPVGSLNYIISDAQSGVVLLAYEALGAMGSQSTSLKVGMYRLTFAGMTTANASFGDFTQTHL